MLSTMLDVLAQSNAGLDASDANTVQGYRFLCSNGVDVTIRNVTLVPVGTDASFTYSDYVYSLQNQVSLGLGPTNYVNTGRVYMAFVDRITNVYPYGGQGSIFSDDRPDPSINANNNNAMYSMTAYYHAGVVGHEIGHNIGAVQLSAPHSSEGYHCHDDADLMCYNDGGSYFQVGGQMTFPCASTSENLMDCGNDDYYFPGTPPPDHYLASHWNTANSGFLTPLRATDSYSLAVAKAGTDSGLVTSSPAGIDCGSHCSAVYTSGTSVSLTATAAAGSTFAGWRGACSGTGTCTVSMSYAQSVTATFNTGPSCSITGTVGNDVLTGTSGADVICGLGGDDIIKGQAGNDIIIGGLGTDRVDYANATAGVKVNLTTGTATGQGTDTLKEIENVDGSRYADRIDGDAGSNWLAGKAGNDSVYGHAGEDYVWGGAGVDTVGGGEGDDRVTGGLGVDTVKFGTAVSVDLTAGTATGQGTDTLKGIENAFGSSGADRLRGNAAVNTFYGRGGNDALIGVGGGDKLFGNAGNDALNGGRGTDKCDGGADSDTAVACKTKVSIP